MERRRPSPIVESTSGGGRDISFVKGGLENLLQENLLIPDVCGRFLCILKYFFSCETQLILQSFVVFQMLMTPRWIPSGGIKFDSCKKQQLVI